MRFIHTADWHLGRSLHGVRLLDEQRAILNQLVSIVEERRPDVLLIAGDIYDRATPPGEAIDLLDDTLSAILEHGVPIIVIGGNHDGPQLINYGSRLFAAQSLYVYGKATCSVQHVTLHDDFGPVHFYPLPYAEPLALQQVLGDETITSHQSAIVAWTKRVFAKHPQGERAIALAHLFVAGGTNCDSERKLMIGGTAEVETSVFAGFNYVALGHLHRRQYLGEVVHYSGSPLKYSFSEEKHQKSVNLVEIDANGRCTIEYLPLYPMRDVRCIRGLLAEVLANAAIDPRPHDYVSVHLLDTGALLDPISRIRELYPNVLETPRVTLMAGGGLRRLDEDHRTQSVDELFADFYEQITGKTLSDEGLAAFLAVLQEWQSDRQEVEA